MKVLTKGRYRVRLAGGRTDLDAVLALRGLCFRGDASAPDEDAWDARCLHVMVERIEGGALACAFRLLPLAGGAAIDTSYSAQFYDLAPLAGLTGALREMGRFCIAPEARGDPHVLRAAWAFMTDHIDSEGVALLFGCSSFQGIDPAAHADTLAYLRARHLAPPRWQPGVKSAQVHAYGAQAELPFDQRRALLGMPPLLRSFLVLGGWVSDHAVIDEDLGTLHVFTGLEIAAVPPARARAMRAAV